MKDLRANQEANQDHNKRQHQPGWLGGARQPKCFKNPYTIEERKQQNADAQQHTQCQTPAKSSWRRPGGWASRSGRLWADVLA
jgi:hypothetical protein